MPKENEWFAQNEVELLRQARRDRERRERERKSADLEARRELHWLKCPRCGADMEEKVLGTVTVDRCGECEGVFFERGELDTLLLEDRETRRGLFRRLTGLFD